MKISSLAMVLLVVGATGFQAQAQVASTSLTNIPAATDYQVAQQDGNSRVWERETYRTLADGEIVTNMQSYTELTTGLNYANTNGQWVPSQEDIIIQSDGTASATLGQHQVFFPANILDGEIELVTPTGRNLKSQPAALSYDDGSNTVLIAVLTNSIGQIINGNQVIYTNAFAGLDADLVYTYRKSGFEQDVVLHEKPSTPASLGLNEATARLQLLTEFFDPPQPALVTNAVTIAAGETLSDTTLEFGSMQMVPGKAFLMGTNSPTVRVCKSWDTIDGRKFLVEEVPVPALSNDLGSLPAGPTVAAMGELRMASRNRRLPAQHLAKIKDAFKMARAEMRRKTGLILDYNTVNSSLTNYTFHGNTTYYIGGTVDLFGTNIFEGGTVIKYTNSAVGEVFANGGIECNTGPYRPVIFTSMNDNSVGEVIPGSTGTPSIGSDTYLDINSDGINDLKNLRFEYAGIAVETSGENIWDSQFVNCGVGIDLLGSVSIFNVLFSNCSYAINPTYAGGIITAENITDYGGFVDGEVRGMDLTNCIFAGAPPGTQNSANNYCDSNPSGAPGYSLLSPNPPFHAIGAGNYYLTNVSNCHGGGTTNINSSLLADLQKKTTYPPMVYSNITLSGSTTLLPQVPRDATGSIDAGYHYAPIDYFVDLLSVTNGTLTISNGTVLAYDDSGAAIWMQDGASIKSTGTAVAPNWFVHYACAQEQPYLIGTNGAGGVFYIGIVIYTHFTTIPIQNALFQFSKFAIPAGASGDYFYDSVNWSLVNLIIQNCELENNENVIDGLTAGFNASALLQNNLFNGSSLTSNSGATTNFSLSVSNNLFFNTTVELLPITDSNIWYFFDNDFDSSTVICGVRTKQNTTNGYNAYLNCTGYLNPTNATDIFSSNSLAYQLSFFGSFYQPTNSPLINAGSTTANLDGLYHFTTQTNQVIEGNSTVDIGYHYVATDEYGNPLDSNGDGIPDYIQDANGNGILDPGEVPFGVTIEMPNNGAVLY